MENKKTTELLDLIHSLVDGEGRINDIEKYEEAKAELYTREPFYTLLHPLGEGTVEEELGAIEEDIKKLKRHKHDGNGDVLIRI
jgi:hypothetical protein